jgi:hypothetical protein
MKKARVKNITFTIPDDWTKDDVIREWNNQADGVIIVCPICHKIDIDITTHFDDCDPEHEQQKQSAMDYYD